MADSYNRNITVYSKDKIDELLADVAVKEATANKYGGIKIGFSQTGRKYPVALENGKAYVEITDFPTTLTAKPTASFLKIAYNAKGVITGSGAVAKSDITALGIPAEDTNTTYTFDGSGTNAIKVYSKEKGSSVSNANPDFTITINNVANATKSGDSDKLGGELPSAYVKANQLGVASGVATLDTTGKVPSSQLPSYVDDVIEGTFVNSTQFKDSSGSIVVGEAGKIYVSTNNGKTYRWSGSAFVVISETLALGETSSTAYAGNKGKQNATDIADLKTRLTAVETSIGDGGNIESRLDAVETKATQNASNLSNFQTTVSNTYATKTTVSNVEERLSTAESEINTLQFEQVKIEHDTASGVITLFWNMDTADLNPIEN